MIRARSILSFWRLTVFNSSNCNIFFVFYFCMLTFEKRSTSISLFYRGAHRSVAVFQHNLVLPPIVFIIIGFHMLTVFYNKKCFQILYGKFSGLQLAMNIYSILWIFELNLTKRWEIQRLLSLSLNENWQKL